MYVVNPDKFGPRLLDTMRLGIIIPGAAADPRIKKSLENDPATDIGVSGIFPVLVYKL
jgi:hypothetical protein